MNPADYDAWYSTPRGRWIGETEWRLLDGLLAPAPGESLLDVGCGTGWFTRRFAASGLHVTGLDRDVASLAWARRCPGPAIDYLAGDARHLPFPARSFDCVASVTALCFVEPWTRAIAEIVRVSRRRFVLGLLNRHGLLWREKGRGGARGAYAGAHWHARDEVAAALRALPVHRVRFRSAVFVPSGSRLARWVEGMAPSTLPFGSFLAVSGDVSG